MASKNMFAVLKKDESDEEQFEDRKTKHQQRAEDKVYRQAEGDYVNKDTNAVKKRQEKPQAQGKDKTYSGTGKREFDRASGTGAGHNNEAKRSGGGKGNWGKDTGEDFTEKPTQEGGKEGDKKEEAPVEPEEPVLTLNDYLAENNLQMATKVGSQSNTTSTIEKVNDKGFHVMKKKEQDWEECVAKNKNTDDLAKGKTTNVEGAPKVEGYKKSGTQGSRGGNKGGKNNKLGQDDFPALG